MAKSDRLTVSNILESLVPGWPRRFRADWPPDVFAAAAALLQKSGAYSRVVMGNWPPDGTGRAWELNIRKIAKTWRSKANGGQPAPSAVMAWWKQVALAGDARIGELSGQVQAVEALLHLCAAADQASAGLGLPAKKTDLMEWEAQDLLDSARPGGSTLCRVVDPSRCRVLPKMHTTQRGLTIRSLSHNLALCWTADVEPRWFLTPSPGFAKRLNFLLVPWPLVLPPRQFVPAHRRTGLLRNMKRGYGFFDFTPVECALLPELIQGLTQVAENTVGPIDGVVLPELAVAESEYDTVADAALRRTKFLICGVKGQGREQFGTNEVRFRMKLWREVEGESVLPGVLYDIDSQPKHHRWLLDDSQIVQYGLGGTLDPTTSWWENIEVGSRHVNFVALEDWLAACVLICEDLARQDPVAEIVRSVGPNLVIALLMDGPQLASRWAARYATVLADDPGSSVLTLTSLGMAELSRPPGKDPARVIGLWKDGTRPEPIEIRLPRDHQGIVLSLSVRYIEEFTADGRSDGGRTGSPTLSGLHPIAVRSLT